jgi:hypothetical protein
MFWIHGGANMGGTGSSEFFTDSGLHRHGVVLVTTKLSSGSVRLLRAPGIVASRRSSHLG